MTRRTDHHLHIIPSVLDRLTGAAENSARASVSWLKEAIIRDLERLLNTRQIVAGLPPELQAENRAPVNSATLKRIAPELQEVRHSVAAYGLPELSQFDQQSADKQEELIAAALQHTIQLFEPRLNPHQLRVTPKKREDKQTIGFAITAVLQLDPAPPEITFDTVLHLQTGRFEVERK